MPDALLPDVISYGLRQGLPAEDIARAVRNWHEDTVGEARSKFEAGNPEKYWKGTAAVDRDVAEALSGLAAKAQDVKVREMFPDAKERTQFLGVLESSGFDPEAMDSPPAWQEFARKMADIADNPVFTPTRTQMGVIRSGPNDLATYSIRKKEGSVGYEAFVVPNGENAKPFVLPMELDRKGMLEAAKAKETDMERKYAATEGGDPKKAKGLLETVLGSVVSANTAEGVSRVRADMEPKMESIRDYRKALETGSLETALHLGLEQTLRETPQFLEQLPQNNVEQFTTRPVSGVIRSLAQAADAVTGGGGNATGAEGRSAVDVVTPGRIRSRFETAPGDTNIGDAISQGMESAITLFGPSIITKGARAVGTATDAGKAIRAAEALTEVTGGAATTAQGVAAKAGWAGMYATAYGANYASAQEEADALQSSDPERAKRIRSLAQWSSLINAGIEVASEKVFPDEARLLKGHKLTWGQIALLPFKEGIEEYVGARAQNATARWTGGSQQSPEQALEGGVYGSLPFMGGAVVRRAFPDAAPKASPPSVSNRSAAIAEQNNDPGAAAVLNEVAKIPPGGMKTRVTPEITPGPSPAPSPDALFPVDTAPPVEAPPVEAPPVEAPPVEAPPVEAPPVAQEEVAVQAPVQAEVTTPTDTNLPPQEDVQPTTPLPNEEDQRQGQGQEVLSAPEIVAPAATISPDSELVRHDKIGVETAQKLVDTIKATGAFTGDVVFVNDNTTVDLGNGPENFKGRRGVFAADGKVYLNADRIREDTPIHEIVHPLMKSMPADLRAQGEALLNSTPEGKKLLADIRAVYQGQGGTDTDSGIIEEALVTMIGNEGAKLWANRAKSSKARQKFETFVAKVKLWLKDVLGIDPDLTLADWAKTQNLRIVAGQFSRELQDSGRNPDKFGPALADMELARKGDIEAFRRLTPIQKKGVVATVVRAGDTDAGDLLGVDHGAYEPPPALTQSETEAVNALPDDASADDIRKSAQAATDVSLIEALNHESEHTFTGWLKRTFAPLFRFSRTLWGRAAIIAAGIAGVTIHQNASRSDVASVVAVSPKMDPAAAIQASTIGIEIPKADISGIEFRPSITWVDIDTPGNAQVDSENGVRTNLVNMPEGPDVSLPEGDLEPDVPKSRKTRTLSLESGVAKAVRKLEREFGADAYKYGAKLPGKAAKAWLRNGVSESVSAMSSLLGKHESSVAIKDMLVSMGVSEDPNTFPWCTTALSWSLTASGIPQQTASSREYLNIGSAVSVPEYGDVVVMWNENEATGGRNGWGGHVGFYLGSFEGRDVILSGNSQDEVNVSAFSKKRVLGYRRVKNNGTTPKYSLDADYFAAVESGDEVKQRELVDQAAKAAGYGIGPMWHFVKERNVWNPDTGRYDVDKSELTEWDPKGGAYPAFYASPSEDAVTRWKGTRPGKIIQIYLKASNTAKEGGQLMSSSFLREEQVAQLKKLGFDSAEGGRDWYSPEFVVFDPNQIKSSEPIVRDASGNVIPLSQRFNPRSNDVRYSLDPERVMYRAGSSKLSDDGFLWLASNEDYASVYGSSVDKYTVQPGRILDLTQWDADQEISHQEFVAELEAAGVDTSALTRNSGEPLQQISQRQEPKGTLAKAIKNAGYDSIQINEYYDGHGEDTTLALLDDSLAAAAGESFSVSRVTPEQDAAYLAAVMRSSVAQKGQPLFSLDAEYFAAVESKDEAKQREIVDQAAKAAGADTQRLFRNSKSGKIDVFTVPGKVFQYVWLTPDESYAKQYGNQIGEFYSFRGKSLDLTTVADSTQRMTRAEIAAAFRAAGAQSVTEDDIGVMGFGGGEPLWRALTVDRGKLRAALEKDGFNSVRLMETKLWETGTPYETVAFLDPSAIKSSEPVVRDDLGNVIPPSERFNPRSNDVRYSLDPEKKLSGFAQGSSATSNVADRVRSLEVTYTANNNKDSFAAAQAVFDPKSSFESQMGLLRELVGKTNDADQTDMSNMTPGAFYGLMTANQEAILESRTATRAQKAQAVKNLDALTRYIAAQGTSRGQFVKGLHLGHMVSSPARMFEYQQMLLQDGTMEKKDARVREQTMVKNIVSETHTDALVEAQPKDAVLSGVAAAIQGEDASDAATDEADDLVEPDIAAVESTPDEPQDESAARIQRVQRILVELWQVRDTLRQLNQSGQASLDIPSMSVAERNALRKQMEAREKELLSMLEQETKGGRDTAAKLARGEKNATAVLTTVSDTLKKNRGDTSAGDGSASSATADIMAATEEEIQAAIAGAMNVIANTHHGVVTTEELTAIADNLRGKTKNADAAKVAREEHKVAMGNMRGLIKAEALQGTPWSEVEAKLRHVDLGFEARFGKEKLDKILKAAGEKYTESFSRKVANEKKQKVERAVRATKKKLTQEKQKASAKALDEQMIAKDKLRKQLETSGTQGLMKALEQAASGEGAPQDGPLNEMDKLMNAELGRILREALNEQDKAPEKDIAQKIASLLGVPELQAGKLAALDAAVEARLAEIDDPIKQAALANLWAEKTAALGMGVISQSTARRMLFKHLDKGKIREALKKGTKEDAMRVGMLDLETAVLDIAGVVGESPAPGTEARLAVVRDAMVSALDSYVDDRIRAKDKAARRADRKTQVKEGRVLQLTPEERADLADTKNVTNVEWLAREYGLSLNGLERAMTDEARRIGAEDALKNFGRQIGIDEADLDAFIQPILAKSMEKISKRRKDLMDEMLKREIGKNRLGKIPGRREIENWIKLAELGAVDSEHYGKVILAERGAQIYTDAFRARYIDLLTRANNPHLANEERMILHQQAVEMVRQARGVGVLNFMTEVIMANIFGGFTTMKVNTLWGGVKAWSDSVVRAWSTTGLYDLSVSERLNAAAALLHANAKGYHPIHQGDAKLMLSLGISLVENDPTRYIQSGEMEILASASGSELTKFGKSLPAPATKAATAWAKKAKYVRRLMVASDAMHQASARELLKATARFSVAQDPSRPRPKTRKEWTARIQEATYGRPWEEAVRLVKEQVAKELETGVISKDTAGIRASRLMDKMMADNFGVDGDKALAQLAVDGQRWTAAGKLPGVSQFLLDIMTSVARGPVLRTMLPAIRTPLTYLYHALEWTPYGAAREWVGRSTMGHPESTTSFSQRFLNYLGDEYMWSSRSDQNTPEYLAELRWKWVSGTMFSALALVAMSAFLGDDDDKAAVFITAQGPSDPAEAKLARDRGLQPFSIRIAGISVNYRESFLYAALAPLGAWSDAHRYGKSDATSVERADFAIGASLRSFLDASSLASYAEVVNAMFGAKDGSRSGGGVVAALSRGASSMGQNVLFPRVGAEINQILFGKQDKKAVGWMGNVLGSVPFTPALFGRPALNVFGENMHDQTGGVLGEIIPFAAYRLGTVPVDDPQMHFVARMGINRLTTTRRKPDLTPVEDDVDLVRKWNQESGKLLREWITPEVMTRFDEFRAADPEGAEKAFDAKVKSIRDSVLNRLIREG